MKKSIILLKTILETIMWTVLIGFVTIFFLAFTPFIWFFWEPIFGLTIVGGIIALPTFFISYRKNKKLEEMPVEAVRNISRREKIFFAVLIIVIIGIFGQSYLKNMSLSNKRERMEMVLGQRELDKDCVESVDEDGFKMVTCSDGKIYRTNQYIGEPDTDTSNTIKSQNEKTTKTILDLTLTLPSDHFIQSGANFNNGETQEIHVPLFTKDNVFKSNTMSVIKNKKLNSKSCYGVGSPITQKDSLYKTWVVNDTKMYVAPEVGFAQFSSNGKTGSGSKDYNFETDTHCYILIAALAVNEEVYTLGYTETEIANLIKLEISKWDLIVQGISF